MPKKSPVVIIGKRIEIRGNLARHRIVQKVVNTFIRTEHRRKGRGMRFRYPVEQLSHESLFITRPGHKKNFDFKVEVVRGFGLGEGSHNEIAKDLRNKRLVNKRRFQNLMDAITKIYTCSENDVDKVLSQSPGLKSSFNSGAKVEVLLKVIKWLFIMEDIVYWDNEGRAFLFNGLRYVAGESAPGRLKEALGKLKNPDRLKSFMRKAGMEWQPVERAD